MWRSYLTKLAISLPLLVVLILMDEITALQGLPLLLIAIGVALVAVEPLRLRLMSKNRAGLAMLPFMAAALVLMFAYCWRRDLSQAILLVITIGVVFDILLVALSAIGEVTKRGLAGMTEFAGLLVMGVALGSAVSALLLLPLLVPARVGSVGMAGP